MRPSRTTLTKFAAISPIPENTQNLSKSQTQTSALVLGLPHFIEPDPSSDRDHEDEEHFRAGVVRLSSSDRSYGSRGGTPAGHTPSPRLWNRVESVDSSVKPCKKLRVSLSYRTRGLCNFPGGKVINEAKKK